MSHELSTPNFGAQTTVGGGSISEALTNRGLCERWTLGSDANSRVRKERSESRKMDIWGERGDAGPCIFDARLKAELCNTHNRREQN
jgi:hypothetical protein